MDRESRGSVSQTTRHHKEIRLLRKKEPETAKSSQRTTTTF